MKKKSSASKVLCILSLALGATEAFQHATTFQQRGQRIRSPLLISNSRSGRAKDALLLPRAAAVESSDLPGPIQDIFQSYPKEQNEKKSSELPPKLKPTTRALSRTAGTSNTTETSELFSRQYPPTPTFRECMRFAVPALGIYLCPPLMSLIDAAFIGRSSSLELAALGPASSISDSAPLPLLFLSIAATNLIAKSVASQDDATSARVSRTALGMGSLCGLALATTLFTLAEPISVLYCGGSTASAAKLLAPSCSTYVAIRALALPFVVVTTIAQAICIGTKDTRTPMISVALAGLCNLVGDLILVQGFKQGIAGAAWATSGSQIVAAGLLVRVLKKRGFLARETKKVEHIKPEKGMTTDSTMKNDNNQSDNTSTLATVKQLLSFIPFLFIMTVKIGWHNSCTATAASLGGVPAAAHTALLSVAMVCMVLGDVGSSLSQAFLPVFEGSTASEDETATVTTTTTKTKPKPTFNMEAAMPTIKQLLKCTVSISAAVTTLAAVMIGMFGGQITSDPAVLAEMKRTLPWILTALTFHGSAVTLEGLLLSRKKFRALSFCYSVLAVTVAGFSIATRRFGLGLAGVWGCYVWFCASRVITFSAIGGLLRPRRWIQKLLERQPSKTPLTTPQIL